MPTTAFAAESNRHRSSCCEKTQRYKHDRVNNPSHLKLQCMYLHRATSWKCKLASSCCRSSQMCNSGSDRFAFACHLNVADWARNK